MRAVLALAAVTLAFASAVTAASAKEAIDYFGNDPSLGAGYSGSRGGEFAGLGTSGPPGPVAVNETGAGPADAGDAYVVDSGGRLRGANNNRVQRFSRDDNGTPALPYDDSYAFVSAWGADVVQGGGAGDLGDAAAAAYEICAVAAECKAGVASGGNGTAAGNGALDTPTGIAVDQDTGDVYVADAGNNRVNVYAGDGTFLRSFGYDVTLSGPGAVGAPDERQLVTIDADGGKFSLRFRGESTGAIGRGRVGLTDEVREVTTTSGEFAVGQAFSAGADETSPPDAIYYPPGTTVAAVDGGTLTVSQPGLFDGGNPDFGVFGDDLDRDASAAEVEAALNDLPTIGGVGGSVAVSGPAGGPYEVAFGDTLAETDVPPIDVGTGGLTQGAGYGSASVTEVAAGGAYEICVAADGDVCRAGEHGGRAGQIGAFVDFRNRGIALGVAVSPADGNPATGGVFLTDAGNRRVNTYALDGSGPGAIGSATEFAAGSPRLVAVDSRGIVYADDMAEPGSLVNVDIAIERYDSADANGGGVGFLDPIRAPVNEVQRLDFDAAGGQFRLTFSGETTADLPFDASPSQVGAALGALPSIGAGNVTILAPSGAGFYKVEFRGALAEADLPELVVSDGAVPLTGTIDVGTAVDGREGVLRKGGSGLVALAVGPDRDSAGPDADVLYSLDGNSGIVQQFGPGIPPGLTPPPAAVEDEHATGLPLSRAGGLAEDPSAGTLLVPALGLAGGEQRAAGVYVLGEAGEAATASLDSLSGVTHRAVTVHGTVDPNGPPDVSYRIEYSADGGEWESTPATLLGSQADPQPVEAVLDPPGVPGGLEPGTAYRVRIVVTRRFSEPVVTSALEFTTLPAPPAPPLAETAGAPVRAATTAQLTGRVDPNGATTTYRFEYGLTDAYGQSTPARAAGSGELSELVSERIEGLEPNATYHYRLLADNGNPGSPVTGEDRTVTTRASDAPLAHGELPGPPGSDRAWELVSAPDTSGNPAGGAGAFSADGNRAVWQQIGGNPLSDTGSANQFLAERTAEGWRTRTIYPSRDQLAGANWNEPFGSADLSTLTGVNFDNVDATIAFFRISPGAAPAKLGQVSGPDFRGWYGASDDGSTTVAALTGSPDPEYPGAAIGNLYRLGAGGPRLVSLLPGGAPAACGAVQGGDYGLPTNYPTRDPHWISADGSRLFFPSQPVGAACGSGEPQLYMRDLGAGATKLVSGPALSGLSCGAAFIRANPTAVFFWTRSRLVAEDAEPADCDAAGSGDVYRYRLADGALECLTCVVDGFAADVPIGPPEQQGVLISADGSRLYFRSPHRLALGAPDGGEGGIYRLRVADGDLAFVAPAAGAQAFSPRMQGSAVSEDGSVLVFASAGAALNPLGEGTDNGGTRQAYRYDDRDRSLVCVSCPRDGAAPRAAVSSELLGQATGPNHGWLSRSGDYVFVTPTPLVGADQNTAGPSQDPGVGDDVYEWRDGKPLLVTDGITAWPGSSSPTVASITPDGRSVFFQAAAWLTADALDDYQRLYVARIGGGFEFPEPPPPCPLEVCQGTPRGAPEESAVGSAGFAGAGNPAPAASSCATSARRAKRLSRRAKRLARRARVPRRRVRRLAAAARRQSRAAKRCRGAARRAAR